MAHVDVIVGNLRIYNKAQAALKVIHRKILREEENQFHSLLKISDDTTIFATICKKENDARLWVVMRRSFEGQILGEGAMILYGIFMKQWPEFGRRPMWKEDWDNVPGFKEWEANEAYLNKGE